MGFFDDPRAVFLAHNGAGPWCCVFCDSYVVWGNHPEARRNRLAVHHVDENKQNNDPANLVPAHMGCHSSYHNVGKRVSDKTRARMSIASRGRRHTPESRAKIGAATRERNLRGGEAFRQQAAEAGRRGAAARWGAEWSSN